MIDESGYWAQLVSTTDIQSEPFYLVKNKITIGRNAGNDVCLSENPFVSGSHCFIERDTETSVVWLHDTSTNGTLLNRTQKLVRQKAQLNHGDEIFVVNRKTDTVNNVAFLFQDLEELRREESLTSDSSVASGEMNRTQPYEATLEDCSADYRLPKRELSVEEVCEPPVKHQRTSSSEPERVHGGSDAQPGTSSSGMGQAQAIASWPSDSSVTIQTLAGSHSIGTAADRSLGSDTQHLSSFHSARSQASGLVMPQDSASGESNPGQDTEPLPLTPLEGLPPSELVGESTSQSSSKHLASSSKPREQSPSQPVLKAQGQGSTSSNLAEKPSSKVAEEPVLSQKAATRGSDLPGSGVSSQDSAATSSSTVSRPATAASSDEIEESLLCVICQEILHNCVSAQPCMHSFCAGCYSEWMQRSNDCPSCRMRVERVNKNHLVNNLVEAYLKANPDKRRPEADLKELDAKNKITDEMLKVRSRRRRDDSEDTASDLSDDEDDEDSDAGGDSTDAMACFVSAFPVPYLFGGGPLRPFKTVCRQCPEFTAHAANAAMNLVAGPSAAANATPTAPVYVCSAAQTHVMCTCCMQPMPDRRQGNNLGVVLPPQSCVICHRVYCHMYWGCTKPGCHGCLGKFSEFPVRQEMLACILLENYFESDIFKRYIETKQISVEQLLKECCCRLAAGSYTCSDQHFLAGGNVVVCISCFRRNFSDLAYQYRKDIPADDLPAEAANRPDCYWGRLCRTQKNKPAHARNYNHICEQTRMA